jgi:hypothetical protein
MRSAFFDLDFDTRWFVVPVVDSMVVSELLPLGPGVGEVVECEDPSNAAWFIPDHSVSETPPLGSGVVAPGAEVGGGICSSPLGAAEPRTVPMEVPLVLAVYQYGHVPSALGVAAPGAEAGGGICSSPLGAAEPRTVPMEVPLVLAVYQYGHVPSAF